MKKTPNFGFNKPEMTDHFNIVDLNENADIADLNMKGNGVKTDLDDLEHTNANQKIENLEVENNG